MSEIVEFYTDVLFDFDVAEVAVSLSSFSRYLPRRQTMEAQNCGFFFIILL